MWKPAYNLTRRPQPPLTAGRRRAMRNRWRARAEQLVAQGLTTRGTLPKRRLENRLLLAEVDALATALAETYHQLPPAAQAAALKLGHSLTVVRKKLL